MVNVALNHFIELIHAVWAVHLRWLERVVCYVWGAAQSQSETVAAVYSCDLLSFYFFITRLIFALLCSCCHWSYMAAAAAPTKGREQIEDEWSRNSSGYTEYSDCPWSVRLTGNSESRTTEIVDARVHQSWDCEHRFQFVSLFQCCCLIAVPSVCHWGCIVFLFCHPYLGDNCPCQIEGN